MNNDPTCCRLEELPLAAEHGAEVPAGRQTREDGHGYHIALSQPAICKAVSQTIHSTCIR